MSQAASQRWRCGDARIETALRLDGGRVVGHVRHGEQTEAVDVEVRRAGDQAVVVRHEGRAHRAVVVRRGAKTWVALDGQVHVLEEDRGERTGPAGAAEPHATSPMTGILAKVAVAPGDAVAEGQELFVVEAMKMEFSVKAPRDVVVRAVSGEAGDKVEHGAPIVVYEEGA